MKPALHHQSADILHLFSQRRRPGGPQQHGPDRAALEQGSVHRLAHGGRAVGHRHDEGHHLAQQLRRRLALDGGEDGLDFYRSITEKGRDCLVTGGRLYFEVGIGQADQVLRMMRSLGFGDIQIVKDTHEIPRVVFGTLCGEI